MQKRRKILFPMIKREWTNLRKNWWLKLVLLVIIFIPIIYTGIFLGSMWDPYGNSDQIPVAVVNYDKPVKYNNSTLHAGKDTVDELIKNNSMDFKETTLKEATLGLKEGTYYMLIEIPENFSKNATTLMDKNPKKMVINYVMNPGKNYIASKMDESAILKIKEAVSSSVTETYARTMFTNIKDISGGLSDGAKAAKKINQGALKLQNGNNQLSSGLVTFVASNKMLNDGAVALNKGITEYTKGVSSLKTGANQLSNGINELSSKSVDLSTGITTLKEGATKLEEGIKAYTNGANQVNAGLSKLNENSSALNSGANNISTSVNTLANAAAQLEQATLNLPEGDPMLDQLKASVSGISQGLAALNSGASTFAASVETYTGGVNQASIGASSLTSKSNDLISGASSLTLGIGQINDNLPALSNGISKLQSGSNKLSQGAGALDKNSPQLKEGCNKLVMGSGMLAQGAGKLQEGSSKLNEGFGQLTDGSSKLSKALDNGALESDIEASHKNVQMFASPVDTKDAEISRVKNNGSAMAPYMMSVALYVAAMAFTLMYPLMNKIRRSKSGLRYWAGKASVMYLVSTLAAITMIWLLILINGLDPVQRVNTFLFAILVAAAFMSMIVFFNAAFGRIGEFIMLIYMVVNLGGSAGTYPLETSAPWFKSIHPYVPFTYSVDGFRNVISMEDPSLMSTDVHMMILMTLCFAVATIVYYSYRRKNPEPILKEAFPDD